MTNETRVLPCECRHDFQDKRYGKGNRLMILKNKANTPTFTCSVCGRLKTLSK